MKINKDKTLSFVFKYGFMVIIALLFVYYSFNSKNFFTMSNIFRTLHNSAPLMVLASGMSLMIIMGDIDISVGTNMMFSACITLISVIRYGIHPLLGVLLGICAGTLVGVINAVFVVFVGIVPLIVTMGTMITFRGIAQTLMRETAINAPAVFSNFGALRIGPVYVDILLALAVVIIIYIIHVRTNYGRHLTVMGNSRDTAKRLGISTGKVSFITFVLTGFLASIAGILAMCQLGSMQLEFAGSKAFEAITVVVLGGISMSGGEGNTLFAVLFGAFALNIIGTGLNFIGASPYIYDLVQGGIIIITMYLQTLRVLSEGKARKITEKML